MDDKDLGDFQNFYKGELPEGHFWFAFDHISMLQMTLDEMLDDCFFTQMVDKEDCSTLTKKIYNESQKFLKQVCVTNNIANDSDDVFPLEYFWLCIWIGTYRIIASCNNLLSKHSIEEVILIEREKLVNIGGLLISLRSFIDLVRDYFISKGIKVKCIKHRGKILKPKTIFYSQRSDWRLSLLHILKFFQWKMFSCSKRNYEHILINPAYDNCINYNRASVYSLHNSCPQVFHGQRFPFLHSWKKLFHFLMKRQFLGRKIKKYNEPVVPVYKCKFFDFEFDFAQKFYNTIANYLQDILWMEKYIDLFWQTCLDAARPYLSIFSLPPIHLHSYFLIRKAKESGGKIAVWQHGGMYGYAEHFVYYIQDYKLADYILSLGRGNFDDDKKLLKASNASCIEVGSNVLYGDPKLHDLKEKKIAKAQGLFIPAVITTSFYKFNRIKWDAPLQFRVWKQIIDFFGKDSFGTLVIKGLKKHEPHKMLQNYIEKKEYKNIYYTDIPTHQALSEDFEFVILDSPSTALLQVLVQYQGPVFLLSNQESLSVSKEPLSLLKRRVAYSESVEKLKKQLIDFAKRGSLGDVNVVDNTFANIYAKRFSYPEYERFLKEGTRICQS